MQVLVVEDHPILVVLVVDQYMDVTVELRQVVQVHLQVELEEQVGQMVILVQL